MAQTTSLSPRNGHRWSVPAQRVGPEPEVGPSGPAGRPQHLRDWWSVVRRYRAMVAIIFGASVALAVVVTLLTPYRYTAVTRLEVAHRSPIQLRLQDSVVRVADGDPGRDAALTFLAT